MNVLKSLGHIHKYTQNGKPPNAQLVGKLWCIHMMEYDSSKKWSKLFVYTAMCMNGVALMGEARLKSLPTAWLDLYDTVEKK